MVGGVRKDSRLTRGKFVPPKRGLARGRFRVGNARNDFPSGAIRINLPWRLRRQGESIRIASSLDVASRHCLVYRLMMWNLPSGTAFHAVYYEVSLPVSLCTPRKYNSLLALSEPLNLVTCEFRQ